MTPNRIARRDVLKGFVATASLSMIAGSRTGAAAQTAPTPTPVLGGSWTNPFSGVTLTWNAPWSWRTAFAGRPRENRSPILYNTENNDYAMFSTTDPFLNFGRAAEFLDKVEADYSTGFFVPFRDNPEQVEIVRQRRTGFSYAVLFGFTVDDEPFFELYDFRYDRDLRLSNNTQLSARGETFVETYESIQREVSVGDAPPFTTIDDEIVIKRIEAALE